jgi:hypothetical protein
MTEHLPKATASMGKRRTDDKMQLIFEEFGVFKGSRELFNRLNMETGFERKLGNDFFYWLYEIGDYNNKGLTALSMLDNYRLVEGEFIDNKEFISKYPDKKWSDYADKTIWEAYEVKDFKLVIKPEYKAILTDEVLNKVMGKIDYLTKRIDGMVSSTDKGMAYRNVFGQMVMLHRGWIPSGLEARLKSRGIDFTTGEIEEGFYRTTGRVIVEMFKQEGNIRQKLAVWNTLDDVEKRNVTRFIADLAFTIAISILAGIVNKFAEDDDEDDFALQYSAFILNRILMEQKAFSIIYAGIDAPYINLGGSEFFELLNSPTPATNTLERLKNLSTVLFDWDKIESGAYKGLYPAQREAIKLFYLNNLYEIQHPKEKNKYLKGLLL